MSAFGVLACTLQVLPDAPLELVIELSRRYIWLYEAITGEDFVPGSLPPQERMRQNIQEHL